MKLQIRSHLLKKSLTLNRLGRGGGRGGGLFDLHCGFSKYVSSTEKGETLFFWEFNITISHIFPENFFEITQVVRRLCRICLSILTIFIDFR